MKSRLLTNCLFLLCLCFGTSLFGQNVGIGEQNPGSKLSVKGNMSVGTDYSNSNAPSGGIIIEGQMGIGTSLPDSNAVIDISTTSKALMLPRLSEYQRMNIHDPTKGLMVYDTDSNYIYYYNSITWVNLTTVSEVNEMIKNAVDNIAGAYMQDVSRGSIPYNGTGIPKLVAGNASDQAASGAKSTVDLIGTNSTNSTGTMGAAGSAGATGPPGASGTTWLTGSSDPGLLTGGNINDLYLNTTSGSYYQKTEALTWALKGSLSGPPGATGATGPAGTGDAVADNRASGGTGTTGTNGTNASTGLTGATGPTGPSGTNGLTGAQGATGANGATGATGATGTTGPSGGGSSGWSMSGNSISTGNFIGTTNSQPLNFKVNSLPAGYLGVTDNNTFLGCQTVYTGGSNNIGIGYKATVYGTITNSIALGNSSKVQPANGSSDDIAIGNGANITGPGAFSYSTVIGSSAQAQSSNSIVIGRAANTNQQYTITIGDAAQAQGVSAMVIGQNAYANSANAIALGASANSQASSAISIGLNAYSNGTSAIAIGGGGSADITQAQGNYSVALGYRAYASQQDAIAIGDYARAQGSNCIALGTEINNSNSNTVAIGNSGVTTTLLNGASSTAYALMVGTNNTNGNGAYLTTGGTWTNASDRNLKEDFTNLNADDVLQKITHMDITRWKYKGTNEYHIGPMAQDFYALFNVGVDNRRISSIDPSGVALVAIKALSEKVDEQQKTIQKLSDELDAEKAHNKK